jgi:hypothetical protein
VDFHVGLANAILVQHDLYVIRSEGRAVWCQILTRPGTTPARGAEVAQAVGAFLLDNVLQRRSSWLGVVMDVRQGPSVFGPITLAMSERIFSRAEEVRKPLAVLLGSSPSQHTQFAALVRDQAPRFARVFDTASAARDWMTEVR